MEAFPMCRKDAKNLNTYGIKNENLVFFDKIGINTNFTKLYAHAHKNERAIDFVPLNKPVTTTCIILNST